MVAVIAVILILGVAFVGYIRGWFGDGSDTASLMDVRGIVNMTREGITYPVEQNTPLRKGDVITMGPGASATIRIADGTAIALGERAVISVTDPSSRNFSVNVDTGELFCIAEGSRSVSLSFELGSVDARKAIFSLSVRSGSATVDVFSGSVNDAAEGETVYYVTGQEVSEGPLLIESLSHFTLTQLRGANSVYETCFSDDDITALEERRREEKETAAADAMREDLAEMDLKYECTVSIVCHTILNNWDKLNIEKQEFVPKDGIILATVRVPFAEGETAFDATKRACDAYGIQMEYSWTPMYDSYYVEGINHIYEFDCGAESGWMFKVNGWFPNYGSSSYILSDGDAVMWEYTCVGLGTDLGSGGM